MDTALSIKEIYPSDRVGLQNPSSCRSPGGGARAGAGAVEEQYCRRSDLLPQLEALAATCYPLRRAFVLPEVQFFRGAEDTGYSLRGYSATLGVLVAPSLNSR